MGGGVYERVQEDSKSLGAALSPEELATLAERCGFGERELEAVAEVFGYLAGRKRDKAVEAYLNMSRLPLKAPRTFEGFDFGRLRGSDRAALEQLPALANLYAGKNIAFIGPEGVGKTHLAQAYARECCMRGMRSYYIKARELRDKLADAVRLGNERRAINMLLRPSCLVLDEIGRCVFDKASTELLFHVVDRRCEREDPNTMILTSNYGPDKWGEFFTGSSTLLCTLDRLFDRASVFMMKGPSFRGASLETFSVETVSAAAKAKTAS